MNILRWTNKIRAFSLAFIATLMLVSCGDTSSSRNIDIPGLDGPHMLLDGSHITISATFEELNLIGGARIAIPEFQNSYVELAPNFSGAGTLFTASIALTDVADIDGSTLDPQKLPGGRALPGVAGGQLPAVAFTVSDFHNVTFYVSTKIFGLFLPLDLSIGNSILTFPYNIGDEKAGNISLVGEDTNGENSGVLLLLEMTPQRKRILRRMAKKYR